MTNDDVIAACSAYSSRRDMRDRNPALLQSVYKRGIKADAFAHMVKERHYVEDAASEKQCSGCNQVKPIGQFFAVGKTGRVRGACKVCCHVMTAQWRASNPDKAKEIQRKSERRYPEKVRERAKAKRKANPYVAAARDMLKRILSITGAKKSGRTEAMMGYRAGDLRRHIEDQFVDGMSWDNHGKWHIDHITPVSVMVSAGETDPSVINALSNLRPLWAVDNLSRGRKARHDYGTD